MANYVSMGMATFVNQSDADFIYDQAKAVAVNSSVANIGQPGERTSYFGVYEEQPDGSLVPLRQWYVDIFGIVREGVQEPGIPAWVQPLGSQDAYPLLDVNGNPCQVTHNGSTWQNNTAANTFEPGVFGWDEV